MDTIEATVTVAGLHHWPDAHDGRAYLRTPHRHDFVTRVEVLVAGTDHGLNGDDLADDIDRMLRGLATDQTPQLVDFGAQTCQDLARGLTSALEAVGYPVVRVSVGEDDVSTATVYADLLPTAAAGPQSARSGVPTGRIEEPPRRPDATTTTPEV